MATVLFLIYLADVIDWLKTAAGFVAFSGGLAGLIAFVICSVEEALEEFFAVLRRALPWYIACIAVGIFMPSKSLVHVAAGLYAGKEVVETEIGQKVYRVLDLQLDKLLESLEDQSK